MNYRITDPNYRTITTLTPGQNAHAMICEAVALEIGCDPDDLTLKEEFDLRGDWTGEELVLFRDEVVARLVYEFGWRAT